MKNYKQQLDDCCYIFVGCIICFLFIAIMGFNFESDLQVYEVICGNGPVQYTSVTRWELDKEIELCFDK